MIRLIVSDMDGTLLKGHNTIHPDNLLAIRAAMAQGVEFAVATGRMAASCGALMRMHGLEDVHIIGVNGCQVMDRPFGNMLALHTMAPEAARKTMHTLASFGLDTCLYTKDAIIYSGEAMYKRAEASFRADDEYTRLTRKAGMQTLVGADAIEAGLANSPLKTFSICLPGKEAAYTAAREACASIPGVALTSSWRDNFEVMPEGVDKGTAVAELAASRGIARDEILAFGDSDNDLPMLLYAGHGYAMANAQEDVLDKVPLHTGHCNDGGVAAVIHKLVLEGK